MGALVVLVDGISVMPVRAWQIESTHAWPSPQHARTLDFQGPHPSPGAAHFVEAAAVDVDAAVVIRVGPSGSVVAPWTAVGGAVDSGATFVATDGDVSDAAVGGGDGESGDGGVGGATSLSSPGAIMQAFPEQTNPPQHSAINPPFQLPHQLSNVPHTGPAASSLGSAGAVAVAVVTTALATVVMVAVVEVAGPSVFAVQTLFEHALSPQHGTERSFQLPHHAPSALQTAGLAVVTGVHSLSTHPSEEQHSVDFPFQAPHQAPAALQLASGAAVVAAITQTGPLPSLLLLLLLLLHVPPPQHDTTSPFHVPQPSPMAEHDGAGIGGSQNPSVHTKLPQHSITSAFHTPHASFGAAQ